MTDRQVRLGVALIIGSTMLASTFGCRQSPPGDTRRANAPDGEAVGAADAADATPAEEEGPFLPASDASSADIEEGTARASQTSVGVFPRLAPPLAPVPNPPSSGRPIGTSSEVNIRRFVLCKSVANREPVEPAGTFQRERGGRIWAFVEAANLRGTGDATVTVSFESQDRPGAASPPVTLKIGPGQRYRTWARVTAWRPAGRYEAVLRDSSGAVVARRPFEVVE